MTDFTVWDQLLRHYVDPQGRVNYQDWQQQAQGELQNWLDRIQPPDDRQFATEQQLAFWLNLYNALTIRQVLQQYPIASIQPKILGIPNWVGFLYFFVRPVYRLGAQHYSLNHIEHQIIRPQFQDPRIHFALVCASVGCPLLRNEAYQPERLNHQLEEDARRFINDPAKVRFDRQTQILYCSKIFQWYRPDFLQVAPSIPAYIQRYLNPFTLPSLSLSDTTVIRYLAYDWELNDQINP
ncbi:MAG: DUF547 domain-containing protein [Oculatellaceae cyanobacterium Prado106]|jgi:hypothetical protein|nr:DUF547 domain-containing protein [Oculatellaceae cyanobacterium Prado106]